MKFRITLTCAATCIAVSIGLSACASMQTRVRHKENLLAAAGFDVHPAGTPEREAELKSLPPNKFVTRSKGDHVEYIYADPLVCNCLYTGDQQAYNSYRREIFQLHLANQQQLTAQLYHEPPGWWDGWRWGPWGWPGPAWW